MYKTTLFTVSFDKEKKAWITEDPQPPKSGKWSLINFHEVKSVDNFKTVFAAVWEKSE